MARPRHSQSIETEMGRFRMMLQPLSRLLGLTGMLLGLALAAPAAAQTTIVFGTDWMAEAEHGGFYQALAMGFYKKHGLAVTIKMGGPQAQPPQAVAPLVGGCPMCA